MATVPPDTPAWGFIEYAITGIAGTVMTIGGFIFFVWNKLLFHDDHLLTTRAEIEILKDRVKITEDHLSSRPTRTDISQVHAMIENRFDQLNTRFDRLDNRVDSILNRK